jgi:hypothetical protein
MGYRERRSIRLNGYNYCSSGIYFVTICTQGKENFFGRIENKKIVLNNFGIVARNEWIRTAHITLKPESLGSIIGQYKSVVTKKIRKMGMSEFRWQRNYYDRVIRNDTAYSVKLNCHSKKAI